MQTQLANHVAAMAPAAMIGVLCGLLGIGFTVINLKVARLRNQVMQARALRQPCTAAFFPKGSRACFRGRLCSCACMQLVAQAVGSAPKLSMRQV